jgi:pimeloyl-ACP methyl ester carboxylesterase/DNA-binding XRE family transcriptional regulator
MVQRYRVAAGLSQEELASRAGLSRRCIADLERGARRSPYPATLRRLADALDLHDLARKDLLTVARRQAPLSQDQASRSPSRSSTIEAEDLQTRVVDSRPRLAFEPRDGQSLFEIHYATRADGARTAFGVAGSGPVLLIPPGVISHLEFWDAAPGVTTFLRPLTEHRTVVLYDRHGCGLSHRERTDFTAEDDMQDIEAVVHEINPSQIDLFGHSWGALPAATYAARHPERIRRLILYGPGVPLSEAAPPDSPVYARRAAMAALRRADPDLFVRSLLMRAFPDGADEDNFRIFVRMVTIAASPEMQDCLETVRFDGHLILGEIQVPTLVLHRRDDQLAPFSSGEYFAQHIPGARFIPLQGNIHFPWQGDWRSVVAPVLEFLLGQDYQVVR